MRGHMWLNKGASVLGPLGKELSLGVPVQNKAIKLSLKGFHSRGIIMKRNLIETLFFNKFLCQM